MDNKFGPFCAGLFEQNIMLDCSSENEHIPYIKRCVRTIRDRTRFTFSSNPFLKIPLIVTIALVMAAAFWIHVFSAGDVVSLTLSPPSIVTGLYVEYNKH